MRTNDRERRRRIVVRSLDALADHDDDPDETARMALEAEGVEATPELIRLLVLHDRAVRQADAGVPWRDAFAESVDWVREHPDVIHPLRAAAHRGCIPSWAALPLAALALHPDIADLTSLLPF